MSRSVHQLRIETFFGSQATLIAPLLQSLRGGPRGHIDFSIRSRTGTVLLNLHHPREFLSKLRALFSAETQARSKRSRFITLVHAAAKSFTNFRVESAQA